MENTHFGSWLAILKQKMTEVQILQQNCKTSILTQIIPYIYILYTSFGYCLYISLDSTYVSKHLVVQINTYG